MVPQLEQEIRFGGREGSNKGILVERLVSALSRIDPVVVGLYKL